MTEVTTTADSTEINGSGEGTIPASSAAQSDIELRAQELESELRTLKEEREKQRTAAAALAAENRQLKRTKMSEAEQLEEQRRETEENAKKYRRLIAGAKAREVLAGSGLSEAEYLPILELITSEDGERTEAIAQEVKLLLVNHAKTVEKAVREKVMKETPAPPASSGAFAHISSQKFAEMSYRERTELFEKDPETYKKLNGGN